MTMSNTYFAEILKDVTGFISETSTPVKLEDLYNIFKLITKIEYKLNIIGRLHGILQIMEKKLNMESAEYQALLALKLSRINNLNYKLGEV